jgi:lipid A disaccharide synthetase
VAAATVASHSVREASGISFGVAAAVLRAHRATIRKHIDDTRAQLVILLSLGSRFKTLHSDFVSSQQRYAEQRKQQPRHFCLIISFSKRSCHQRSFRRFENSRNVEVRHVVESGKRLERASVCGIRGTKGF